MADTRLGPGDVLRTLAERVRLWLVPTAVMAAAAVLFALVKPDYWEASQALIVRHEAAGSERSDGRFGDLSEMKTVQETILELIRSRRVVEAVLRAVGPPGGAAAEADWPSGEAVADLRQQLRMVPPAGAEFGATEVFYVKLCDPSRDRAIALVDAMCTTLEQRFRELRDTQAQSLVSELARSEALAEEAAAVATKRLVAFERQVGADLAELRILHASPAGNSDLRQELVAMENDLRSSRAAQQRDEQLLEVLEAVRSDPQRIVATPNSLLESQPALRRLKEGLVDAQLRTAQLTGTMTAVHPLVRAARDAEAETRAKLHDEVTVAIQGVHVDLKLSADRAATLEQQLAARRGRLERLAGMRADYANLVTASQNRAELLEATRRDLAATRARQATAHTTNLIGRIDAPEGGIHPVGPSGQVIVLAGAAGGLMVGLGLVFLVATPTAPPTGPADRVAPLPRASKPAVLATAGGSVGRPPFSRALKRLAGLTPSGNGSGNPPQR